MNRRIKIATVCFAAALLVTLACFWPLLTKHLPRAFADPAEDMSYGWFIPVFSLYVLWTERREIVSSPGAPSPLGLVVLLPAAFVGCLGVRGQQVHLEVVGFVGVLVGLVWTCFGAATVRRVLFPFGFLLFCLPLHAALGCVTVHLRTLAASVGHSVLCGVGVDAIREGTRIFSPSGAFSVDVAEPCSGLRSILAMAALAAGYAYFTQPTWLRRGLLFALAVPIAVLGNAVRILLIVIVAVTFSNDFAMGFYHDYSGYVVFLVAVLLMVAVGGVISKGADRK